MSDCRPVLSANKSTIAHDVGIGLILELRGIPLFRGLNADELVPVAAIATHVEVERDEIIFEQAGVGDRLYVISRGEVAIVRDEEQLAVLGPGECFGEMALLERTTRSATARALERTTLLTITHDDFNDLLSVYPIIARAIARVLVTRLREAYEKR